MAEFSKKDQEELQELLSKLMEGAEDGSILGKMAKKGSMLRWDQPLPSGGQMSGMNTMMPVSTGDVSKIPSIMEGLGGTLGLAKGLVGMADAGAFTQGRAGDYWKHDFLGMKRPEGEAAAVAAAEEELKKRQEMVRGMFTGEPGGW
jgi:hypothetical protein